MTDGFLAYHIGRCNRKLLVLNVLIVLMLIGAAFLTRRYLVNFIIGPTSLQARDLRWNLIPENELLYYVTVDAEKSLGAGYTDISRKVRKGTGQVVSESVTAYYVVMVVNDRLLIVKSSVEHPNTHVTGALVPIPPALHAGFVQQVEAKAPEAQDRFLPYMLDATGFRGAGWIGLAIGLPVFALCLWNIKKAWGRMGNPVSHPIAKSLARFGSFEEVEQNLTDEVRQVYGATRCNHRLLTRNWLLVPSAFGLSVIHINEIVWIYQKTTKHSVNFVPTGKSYQAVIYHHHGMLETATSSEEECQRLLGDLHNRAPWILVGFDDELAALWKKSPAVVYQVVEDRRQQALGISPTEQPPTAPVESLPEASPGDQIRPG